MFSRDNHKTASWVIDIEVIGLIQHKISFAGPLQVRNVILCDNYFMRFSLKEYLSMEIPRFQTLYFLCTIFICLLPYILKP